MVGANCHAALASRNAPHTNPGACGTSQRGHPKRRRPVECVSRRRRLMSALTSDRADSFVDALTVLIEEGLELRHVEIGEFLSGIGERGGERLGMRALLDGLAQGFNRGFRRT